MQDQKIGYTWTWNVSIPGILLSWFAALCLFQSIVPIGEFAFVCSVVPRLCIPSHFDGGSDLLSGATTQVHQL